MTPRRLAAAAAIVLALLAGPAFGATLNYSTGSSHVTSTPKPKEAEQGTPESRECDDPRHLKFCPATPPPVVNPTHTPNPVPTQAPRPTVVPTRVPKRTPGPVLQVPSTLTSTPMASPTAVPTPGPTRKPTPIPTQELPSGPPGTFSGTYSVGSKAGATCPPSCILSAVGQGVSSFAGPSSFSWQYQLDYAGNPYTCASANGTFTFQSLVSNSHIGGVLTGTSCFDTGDVFSHEESGTYVLTSGADALPANERSGEYSGIRTCDPATCTEMNNQHTFTLVFTASEAAATAAHKQGRRSRNSL
jgi:hypothetical protein